MAVLGANYSIVIVLNNYLYIDGGEINFLDNRESEPVHSPGEDMIQFRERL